MTRLLLSFVSRPRGWLRHACGMRRHQREHCGMPAGDACGMPAGSAGMLQQACAYLAQASKMERMPECLLNRRHCKGTKSFYYGRHSGILSILLVWVSKTHACWRMPAQPAGMPAGRRHAAGMPQASRGHPLQASRRHPLDARASRRHAAASPWAAPLASPGSGVRHGLKVKRSAAAVFVLG